MPSSYRITPTAKKLRETSAENHCRGKIVGRGYVCSYNQHQGLNASQHYVQVCKNYQTSISGNDGLNKRCMHSRTPCAGPCGHSYRSPVPNGLPRRAGSKVPALEEIGTASPVLKLTTTPNTHNHGDVMRSTRIRERERAIEMSCCADRCVLLYAWLCVNRHTAMRPGELS